LPGPSGARSRGARRTAPVPAPGHASRRRRLRAGRRARRRAPAHVDDGTLRRAPSRRAAPIRVRARGTGGAGAPGDGAARRVAGAVAHLIGADGCRGGWITAERIGAEVAWSRIERLEVLFEREDVPAVVAVDAPIGLLERGARACDVAARAALGPRRSSVFPAPLRPLLQTASYGEASRLREQIEGKRISRQTWGILPKIRELDDLLRANPAARSVTNEVHPEVSFLKLNRDRPLRANKRTPDGRAERLALLRRWCADAID